MVKMQMLGERPMVEKLILAGAGVVLAKELIGRLPAFPKWERTVPVVYKPTSEQVSSGFECLRPGSEEIAMTRPKCQCLIGEMKNGEFAVDGNAIIMGLAGEQADYWFLNMPYHVWSGSERIWAKGTQSQVELTYKRNTEDEVFLGPTDWVAIRITPKEMSTRHTSDGR